MLQITHLSFRPKGIINRLAISCRISGIIVIVLFGEPLEGDPSLSVLGIIVSSLDDNSPFSVLIFSSFC